MKIIQTDDILKLKKDYARAVVQKITQTMSYSDAVYLYLSGGSVSTMYPLIFSDELVQHEGIEKLIVAQVDERYFEKPTHKDSNQKIIKQLVPIGKLRGKDVRFKFILEGENVEDTVQNYEEFLQSALDDEYAAHIGLLGIGEDSHIAGLKPGVIEKVKDIHDKLFISYESDDFPIRTSMTFKMLEKLDYSFVYATGESKTEALKNIASQDTNLDKYPIQILNELYNSMLYTDQLT